MNKFQQRNYAKYKMRLKRCINKGIKIILTSGRSRQEALEYQEQVGTTICYTFKWSVMLRQNKTMSKFIIKPINKEILDDLLEYAEAGARKRTKTRCA